MTGARMKNTPNVLGDDSLGFWRGGDISYQRDVNPSSSIEKQSHQTSLLSNNIQLALHIARQILQFFAMNTPCKSNKTSGLLLCLCLVLRATVTVMKIVGGVLPAKFVDLPNPKRQSTTS